MRSIPLALTWEMLSRGRWTLLAGVLGAAAFPTLIFTALRSEGVIPLDDPVQLLMHVLLMQINMFAFGASVLSAQGKLSRLYTYPASSATIVAWHMLPAMAAMALESVACTAALNVVFGLEWPLWGPAMLLAVALAAVQATIWLVTDKSAWLPFAVAVIGGALGIWFKSRYGPVFDHPATYWRQVTPGEGAVMVLIAGLSYAAGVIGVSRNRRGEPPLSVGILAWLERLLDVAPAQNETFPTAWRAQYWFQWRQKGWIMPACVAFGLLCGFAIWLIFNRDPHELFDGIIAGGAGAPIAAIIGALVIGNVGVSDARTEMGPFAGTRPMTTSDMAGILLRVAARSVVTAWLIWAIPFSLCVVLFRALGIEYRDEVTMGLWTRYLGATLLGAWLVAAVGASAGMTGRQMMLVKLLSGALIVYLVATLMAKYLLSSEAQLLFGQVALIVVGVVCWAGTAWAFVAARRRGLISPAAMATAASIWAVLAVAVAALRLAPPAAPPLTIDIATIGLAALVVAPWATAPLALAWNRTR